MWTRNVAGFAITLFVGAVVMALPLPHNTMRAEFGQVWLIGFVVFIIYLLCMPLLELLREEVNKRRVP